MQAAFASHRLFLALWPRPATLATVEQHARQWAWPDGARATRSERLHVTLHFIGAVAVDALPGLVDALRTVHCPGDLLLLDRAAVWPGGIAALEATAVPPALQAVHAELAAKLRALALPVEERRYRPHVTLARKARGARPPAGFAPVPFEAEAGFALVRTLPGGRGYETLQRFG